MYPLDFAALPHEQLPILEVDDKVLPQSNAQLRYVGKLAGMHNSRTFVLTTPLNPTQIRSITRQRLVGHERDDGWRPGFLLENDFYKIEVVFLESRSCRK